MTRGVDWLPVGIVWGFAIVMLAVLIGGWLGGRIGRRKRQEQARAEEVASLHARMDRMTEQLERSEARLTTRIEQVEAGVNRRIEQVNARVTVYR